MLTFVLGLSLAASSASAAQPPVVGARAVARLESAAKRLGPKTALSKLGGLLLAGEFDFTVTRHGRLSRLTLPDLRTLDIPDSEVDAFLGPGKRGRDLVKAKGLWSPLFAAAEPQDVDAFGRSLALYDIAVTRLEMPARSQGELPVPVLDDPLTGGALAYALSLEYVQRKAASARAPEARWLGDLTSWRDQLWRHAQNRSGPHELWLSGEGLSEAVAARAPWRRQGEAVVFLPRGEPPLVVTKDADAPQAWKVIEAALLDDSGQERMPLSPEAADALNETLTVMAQVAARRGGAAVWDGAFLPPPETAPAPWFRGVAPESSGLKLPVPEAPLHDWDAPAEMPGGLAVLDYDGDDRPDLLFCDVLQARLYRNLGGLRFEDATAAVGLTGAACNGASSADFDNDGRPDLFLSHDRKKQDHLYRNELGRFVDVTRELGLSTAAAETTSVVWFDYDRDGRLDLYLMGGGDYHGAMPTPGDARNARPDRLYHNLGDGFEETALRAGLADPGWGLAAAAFDYDGDGWPDLDVVNDFGRNKLYRNQGDGTFKDVARPAGVDSVGNGMGVSVADYDHDGRPDLMLTYIGDHRPAGRRLFEGGGFRLKPQDYYEEGVVRYPQRNRLFHNEGGGRFQDVTAESLEDVPTGWGWNGFFLDAGNRGWSDLYQVNGWWSHRLAYGEETKVFWRYDPAQKRFKDASAASGADFSGNSRASAAADLDGDGCLDLLVTGFHPTRLFAGACPAANHWLEIELEGRSSNRDGIGARVTVRAGKLTQTEELGPQGGGFQNSHPRRLHLGLGNESRVDEITVLWPSGTLQKLGPLAADRVLVISEEESLEAGLRALEGSEAVQSLHHKAVAHWGLAVYETAAGEFGELLLAQPNSAGVHANLGLMRLSQRKHEAALASLERAARLAPDSARLRYHLGRALLGLERPAEAEPLLLRAAALDPREPAVALRLSEAYQSLGRTAEAERQLRRVLELEPRHASALNRLGRLLERRGEKIESAALLRRFASLDPRAAKRLERCRYDAPLEAAPGEPPAPGQGWLAVQAAGLGPGERAVVTLQAGRLTLRQTSPARFELGGRAKADAVRVDWPNGTHSYRLDVDARQTLVVKEIEAHVW